MSAKYLLKIIGYSVLLAIVAVVGYVAYSLNAFGIKGKMIEKRIEERYTQHKAEMQEIDGLCKCICGKYDLNKLVMVEYGDFESIKLRFKLNADKTKETIEYYYRIPGYEMEAWRVVADSLHDKIIPPALLNDPVLFHLFDLFTKLKCDFVVASNEGTFIGLFEAIAHSNPHSRSGLFLPTAIPSSDSFDNGYIKKVDTRVFIEDINYRMAEK